VTSPSVSPENTFIKADGKRAQFTYGVTMDLQIVRDLLTNCVEASTILDTDAEFRAECEAALKKLAPLQISKRDGRLQEWIEDYKDAEPQHRHVSHLFGLHPGREITVATTPELAEAAKKTLLARGDGGTGWSMAWKVNFWARLQDGDHAHLMLKNLLSKGTLPNLFDTHSPFQIDGNFGGTAGMAEMLLQSHARAKDGGFIVDLLPALPKAWPSGSVRGLKARGNVTVDLEWKDGKLSEAKLSSPAAQTVHVRREGKVEEMKLEAGKALILKR
jgi:alpha-L-fucosidase 2